MKIFGVPIQFQLSFFLIIGLLGFNRMPEVGAFLSWIGVATFSILIHELGHAVACRAFGLKPRIVFYGLGGATTWTGPTLTPWRDIAVSLAGPGAGFLLGGLALGVGFFSGLLDDEGLAGVVFSDLLWINIGWGVLNLLPMLPLDGGRVLQAGLRLVAKPRTAHVAARVVSLVIAAAAALGALSVNMWWGAMLAGWFAWSNLQGIRQPPPETPNPERVQTLLQRGAAALREGRPQDAVEPLTQALAAAPSFEPALLLSDALIQSGRPQAAWTLFGQLHDHLPRHEALELEQHVAAKTAAFERAAEAGEALFALNPSPRIACHIACAHARLERVEDAFTWLERALELADEPSSRTPTLQVIAHASDLEALRRDLRWEAWSARHLPAPSP